MTIPIRVKVRAVIIRSGAILLSEYDDESGLHYNLPGGTVEDGEDLHSALAREVREETGWIVRVGQLRYVWEYVPQQRNFCYGAQQNVTLCFACDVVADTGKLQLDPNQTGARWVSFTDLPQTKLLPPEISPYLTSPEAQPGALFLGSI